MSTGMTNESHVACTAAAGSISHLGIAAPLQNLTFSNPFQAVWLAFGIATFHILCFLRRFNLTNTFIDLAITHIYDATTHPSLAQTATHNLQICMSALKQMGVAWPCASRSYLMIGEAPRLGSCLAPRYADLLAENLHFQETGYADFGGDQFNDFRGTKREGETFDTPNGSMFGDDAYDAMFWNQIANSTELPWGVIYPEDSQDHSFL